MKRLFFLGLLIPLFIACNNDDSVNSRSYSRVATVENPSQSTRFFLNLDDSTKLWVADSYVNYYRPKNDQRVIANYSIISKKNDTVAHDYDVVLNDVYEILTKPVFNITPETQDSIGNDPIQIRDMWVANDHLTVEFSYPGYSKVHYINLVFDASKTYTDNKVHLEFRHNDNNDYPSFYMTGIASFNLKSVQNPGASSVELVIHTKEYNSSSDRSYNFTYKYGTAAVMNQEPALTMPVRKALAK